jgi:hypothetical protein
MTKLAIIHDKNLLLIDAPSIVEQDIEIIEEYIQEIFKLSIDQICWGVVDKFIENRGN